MIKRKEAERMIKIRRGGEALKYATDTLTFDWKTELKIEFNCYYIIGQLIRLRGEIDREARDNSVLQYACIHSLKVGEKVEGYRQSGLDEENLNNVSRLN